MSDTATLDAPETAETAETATPETTTDTTTSETADAPVEYTLQLPQDSTLDPTVLERTAAIARERGLSNEQAQATLDLLHQEVASREAALLASHAPGGEAWTKQVEGWEKQTLADASLGKTPEERKAAVQRGTQLIERIAEQHPEDAAAFKSFLNDSGLGSHPVAVRIFARLGAMASETPVKGPHAGASDGAKTLAQKLYPNLP